MHTESYGPDTVYWLMLRWTFEVIDRYIWVKESIHSKIYNLPTYIYTHYDHAPSTKDDIKWVNPCFHYGPVCGGMT